MNTPLEFDGERFTPECVREIWYEHFHRYVFASQWVTGRKVLDAACGEGYGSALLARSAKSVIGIDASGDTIEHARKRYVRHNLQFKVADCCDLPFDSDEFDCIVSFETIEHLSRQEDMLREFRRVLRPDGFLLISSPDKAVYSEATGFDNVHHVKELYADEFRDLLAAEFPVLQFFGQKLLFHSAIWPVGNENTEESIASVIPARIDSHGEDQVQALPRPVQAPMYLLAMCAAEAEALPDSDQALWLFDDAQESVYQHYQHEIRKNMAAGAILAEREEALERARNELARRSEKPRPERPWWHRLNPLKRLSD